MPSLSRLVFTRAVALLLVCLGLAVETAAEPTQVQYLSGTGSDDTVEWEFRVNGGRRSGEWATIPVPSNWEMQGFGTYHYWRDWGSDAAEDSLGEYRHTFAVPADWAGRAVRLVFGGVMTDTRVRVNGHEVGPVHQGGFYEFGYDITAWLEFGADNTLEVDVQKFSANESVNVAEREADFWLFGGIFRPVWLEARPAEHIAHVAIAAEADGRFRAELELASAAHTADAVAVTLFDRATQAEVAQWEQVIQPGATNVSVAGAAEAITAWTAEAPHLYTARVALRRGAETLHTVEETFGFRTIEVRPKDGLYVNGSRVVLKGVNRHTAWPTSGRTTNATLSREDIRLMKEMNMNAVRMSHYPPDSHFLAAADEMGLYVIDELTGWQRAYDEEVGAKLVRELVRRDVNHPSIILWANGNEGGWNRALDDDFADYDPQARVVIHPWLNSNGINTAHYEAYDTGTNFFFHGDDIIMPTEFLHALYDGGGAAGLDDWWTRIWNHPLAGGGFLWVFADEGIVRDDQDGRIDVAGNRAPDGLVGPYREKEGSFYAVKEIWSPVYLPLAERDRLPVSFDGRLMVENRYDHTDLAAVQFDWKLRALDGGRELRDVATGEAPRLALAPRLRGWLDLGLPDDWADAEVLELAATGPDGREIYRWNWMLREPAELVADWVDVESSDAGASVTLSEGDGQWIAQTGDVRFVFDAANGRLIEAYKGGQRHPWSNGPIAIGAEARAKDVTGTVSDGRAVIRADYEGGMRFVEWTLEANGWLRLDYQVTPRSGQPTQRFVDYIGVSFDFAEDGVTGVDYLGKGPYRVWKNRRKGVEYGVWQKDYNDTATGASWVYPEFKGFHEDLYWATLHSERGGLTMVSATTDLYLGLFTPAEGPDPRTSHVEFPDGDLSFLHGITPIGTKFQTAAAHGPQGAPNLVHNYADGYRGTLYFRLE
ncbi:glycoside hydrolase family 2 TIM barrel-domain containing protein [Actomonas aquatica]|uniref:beta-galactosidase n=1 Tax=Actomonas aquatica TaxID=2866162 RepID=A0ABZ1C5U9_9BACT|nr:glycoside hydrolase family 2 TIM barrel-domain containing protein [Opitutus sp. WL0086]WRQ86735.1 glycoside hydrolase family 2 TIM barrel-domain containing protein [Opitutus sp. WL0086]